MKRTRYRAKQKRAKGATRYLGLIAVAIALMFFPAISFWSANMISNIRVIMLLLGIIVISGCTHRLSCLFDEKE